MSIDDHSHRVQSVYSDIEAMNDIALAILALRDAYRVDHVTYHLSQTLLRSVDAPFVRTTYGQEWVTRYLLRGYVSVDSVVREGFLRPFPFDWREVEPKESAQNFLHDAIEHGVGKNGFSIPIIDKSRRALLSFNSKVTDDEWDDILVDARDEWLELALLIHRKAIFEVFGRNDPVPILSRWEVECLHWLALGNDHKDVALKLGRSEHTTHSYLKSARHKLGCLTTSAATARAVQLRLINPYDNTPI